MALELYMVGLVARDMDTSLDFYRRLGLAIPAGSDDKTHVGVKMESGLTFFLDSRPSAWDAKPGTDSKPDTKDDPGRVDATDGLRVILEFYLVNRAEVETKYTELTGYGYRSRRAPFETSFGMYFALIDDPDGNTILLSAD